MIELFGLLVFNILCCNTDDHAGNHAAFWNGEKLSLTPAHDICPQLRTGGEASQAMLIVAGVNTSRLAVALEAAPAFLLSRDKARALIRSMIETIRNNWEAVCDEAALTVTERDVLWNGAFLRPFAFQRLDDAFRADLAGHVPQVKPKRLGVRSRSGYALPETDPQPLILIDGKTGHPCCR